MTSLVRVASGGFAARLGALSGWRRATLAVALGAVAAGALPPLYVVPLVVVAACILWRWDHDVRRRQPSFIF